MNRKAYLFLAMIGVVGRPLSSWAEGGGTMTLRGHYRLRATQVKNLQVDYRGHALGQGAFLEHRLRVSPEARATEHLTFVGEIDFFSGMVAGDRANGLLAREEPDRTRPVGRSRIDTRQLFMKWLTPVGLLQVGQAAAHWGLGLLAHDGQPGRNDWGDEYSGSLYDQIVFGTKPFLPSGGRFKNLVTAIGTGFAYRDPLADLVKGNEGNPAEWDLRIGDKAWQGFLVLLNDEQDRHVGSQGVMRRQRFEKGGDLKAWLGDVYADWALAQAAGFSPYLKGEIAGGVGSSTEFTHLNALRKSRISQGGGMARIGARRDGLDASAEMGYASGDKNPFDDRVTQFVFHPDYNVGLVLFDEVIAHFTAASASLLSDPALLGRAPGGIQLLPTNGGVTNALYLLVRGKQRIWGSSESVESVPDRPTGTHVDCLLAFLYARSDQPLLDPAGMTLNETSGGSPSNFLGGAASSRDLGFEVNAGVRGRYRGGRLTPELGVEYGHFFPGAAFNTPSGERMPTAYKLRLRAGLNF